jgi:hypothetical protein
MFRPLLNRTESLHQTDDDRPSWPSPLDDFASPQAKRLERLVQAAIEKNAKKSE